ncbi:hypothetical protein B9Q04_16685 [Candidatus Marsarchaeota G2 archaeon BE_D]|jgi:iron complex transport system substrate-binding protein|uniref:Fe/B12 periplasmic-binding domain-containing protein n=1 Tax=Candidatus Marsarchaeota G2 archaeon BE_D TaxID=1978158 RepID=A0A2R6C6F8_9ARCH|nr:MAG: hypothetical protein B9Q04_16685 [Candidatus Marsarchaeota G2 archaeon BE_D]
MRIVSLFPGGTEIVCALGAIDELVGVSHECDYPPQVSTKPRVVRSVIDRDKLSSSAIHERVGSTRRIHTVDVELLKQLNPDVVVAQNLCSVCAVPHTQVLEAIGGWFMQPRVVGVSAHTLGEVIDSVKLIGEAIGRDKEAEELAASMRERVSRIVELTEGLERPRTMCVEWINPLMVGGDWIPELVELAGGINCFTVKGDKSRRVSGDDVIRCNPQIIVLMPCGFSVERTLKEIDILRCSEWWRKTEAYRDHRIYAVDGRSLFTRLGPRLVDGLECLADLLHPYIFMGSKARHAKLT